MLKTSSIIPGCLMIGFSIRTQLLNIIFDPSSGKYKVLCMWWNLEPNITTHCEFLTIGEEEEEGSSRWRIIDPPKPEWNHRRAADNAYANGSIYWLDKQKFQGDSGVGETCDSLIAFDLGSEKFRRILIPKFAHLEAEEHATEYGSKEMAILARYEAVETGYDFPTELYSYARLKEMDGCLTLIRRENHTVKMWKFHDYNEENGMPAVSSEKEDWTEMEDIRLPCDITFDVFVYFRPIPGKRQLILETYISTEFTPMDFEHDEYFNRNVKFARFYSYNMTNKTFNRLRINGVSSLPDNSITICAPLVESLLPGARFVS